MKSRSITAIDCPHLFYMHIGWAKLEEINRWRKTESHFNPQHIMVCFFVGRCFLTPWPILSQWQHHAWYLNACFASTMQRNIIQYIGNSLFTAHLVLTRFVLLNTALSVKLVPHTLVFSISFVWSDYEHPPHQTVANNAKNYPACIAELPFITATSNNCLFCRFCSLIAATTRAGKA